MSSLIDIDPKSATREALAFSVDYNLVGAAVITAGVRFNTQAQITAFLAANGTTAFKYVSEVWSAVPTNIRHSITITVVAGIQRPIPVPVTAAFPFSDRQISDGAVVTVQGALSSTWTPVVASQIITAVQAGSADPFLDFGGTPFTGLDLKGRHVVLSTGQVAVIHDHTASRLYLLSQISPAPTPGVSTAVVASPTTIFRNSLNDSTAPITSCVQLLGPSLGITFNDITFDNFSGTGAILSTVSSGRLTLNRCHLDAATSRQTFAINTNGQGLSASQNSRIVITDTSFRDIIPTSTAWLDDWVTIATPQIANFTRCFWRGSENGLSFSSGGIYSRIINCVFDAVGSTFSGETQRGWFNVFGGQALFDDSAGFGKRTEFRNMPLNLGGGQACIYMERGQAYQRFGGTVNFPAQGVLFKNNAASAVRLGPYGYLDLLSLGGFGFRDGGGNTGWGFVLDGPLAGLLLDAATDITGTLGNVKMPDGSVETYVNIVATGPLSNTQYLSYVSKA